MKSNDCGPEKPVDSGTDEYERPVDRDVYAIEVDGETSHTINGEFSTTAVNKADSVWGVEDIHNGRVHVSGLNDDPDISSLVSLEPNAARRLGNALIEASKYAYRQESGDE